MCSDAYPEVNNASKVDSKRATPHSGENNHNKQPARGVRDVPQRIFAGIEYVVIGVIETQREFLHFFHRL